MWRAIGLDEPQNGCCPPVCSRMYRQLAFMDRGDATGRVLAAAMPSRMEPGRVGRSLQTVGGLLRVVVGTGGCSRGVWVPLYCCSAMPTSHKMGKPGFRRQGKMWAGRARGERLHMALRL